MAVSRFAKPTNQHIVPRIQKDNPRHHTDRCRTTPDGLNGIAGISVSCVKDKADAREALGILPNLLNERREELVWEVIDGTEANVFE
jgi:hypothetical protein